MNEAGPQPAGHDREDPHRDWQVTFDEDYRPFEAFPWVVNIGIFGHGMPELACRLLFLHLRLGTPLYEMTEQCRRIKGMAPTPHLREEVTVMWNMGVGDAIPDVLEMYSRGDAEDLYRSAGNRGKAAIRPGHAAGERRAEDGAVR